MKKAKSVIKVTKSLNKKGKLKGSNKKETKMLKGICPHHKITKKGKVVPTIFNNGDYCICSICGGKFPASFYTNDEMDTIVGGMKEMNNQAKFMSIATNAGDQMSDYFATMGSMLVSFKKNAKKLRTVAEKQGSVREKKKKRNQGSSMYGSWGHR